MLFEDSSERIAREGMPELVEQRPEGSPFLDAAWGPPGVEPGLKNLQRVADARLSIDDAAPAASRGRILIRGGQVVEAAQTPGRCPTVR